MVCSQNSSFLGADPGPKHCFSDGSVPQVRSAGLAEESLGTHSAPLMHVVPREYLKTLQNREFPKSAEI